MIIKKQLNSLNLINNHAENRLIFQFRVYKQFSMLIYFLVLLLAGWAAAAAAAAATAAAVASSSSSSSSGAFAVAVFGVYAFFSAVG